jgi:putative chitinase
MRLMDTAKLQQFAPLAAKRFASALSAAEREAALTTPMRLRYFLAQAAEESAGFSRVEESFAYSAQQLHDRYPSCFPTMDVAERYVGDHQRIANRLYAGRVGNGPEGSNDGWTFRGRGLFQISGRKIYGLCSIALFGNRQTLLDNPDLLSQTMRAALSAAWYWRINRCNSFADRGDFEGLTREINGGLNGLQNRLYWLRKAEEAFP